MKTWRCSACGLEVRNVLALPVYHTCKDGQVVASFRELIETDEPDQTNELGQPNVSRGLGDTIAKVTSALGIEPCNGCSERQEFLNKMFPYSQYPQSPEYLAEQERKGQEDRL